MIEFDDELWNIKTLGFFLGGKKDGEPLGRAAIKRMVRDGILTPPIKIGANERFRKSNVLRDLQRLEETQRKTAEKIEARRIKRAATAPEGA